MRWTGQCGVQGAHAVGRAVWCARAVRACEVGRAHAQAVCACELGRAVGRAVCVPRAVRVRVSARRVGGARCAGQCAGVMVGVCVRAAASGVRGVQGSAPV